LPVAMTRESSGPAAGPKDRLCVALDLHDARAILNAVRELKDLVGYFKLNSAFTLFGPPLIRSITTAGAKVFLDLKLHDIPNTVASYGETVTRLGVHLVTVHVEGGKEMLEELVRSVDRTARKLNVTRPKLIGVSLLTSIDQELLNGELNIEGRLEDEVVRRGRLAAEAGLDGIVCSAHELPQIRPSLPPDFYFVTPGLRLDGVGKHDHRRSVSCSEAIRAGSDLLVVGRGLLDAKDRRAAARALYVALEEGARLSASQGKAEESF
jgi:orotidine-5'-phosphate decarboxylase